MEPSKTVNVCFVCLGNICRSPLAQGLCARLVAEEGLAGRIHIESAGTGDWHVGKLPDSRMQATANKNGLRLTSRARQFRRDDFDRFDLVVAMDRANEAELSRMCAPETAREKLKLFRSFDPQCNGDPDVPDPYYGGNDGFDVVFQIVQRACPEILKHVKTRFLDPPA
ncbi:MAG: low molecular weight phosphotyrosine protein phosphatase [Nitrospinae bacterium]|nr:low molecular weight phosphotyrosine protein phosphatase [Nitrospinota bacterium]